MGVPQNRDPSACPTWECRRVLGKMRCATETRRNNDEWWSYCILMVKNLKLWTGSRTLATIVQSWGFSASFAYTSSTIISNSTIAFGLLRYECPSPFMFLSMKKILYLSPFFLLRHGCLSLSIFSFMEKIFIFYFLGCFDVRTPFRISFLSSKWSSSLRTSFIFELELSICF